MKLPPGKRVSPSCPRRRYCLTSSSEARSPMRLASASKTFSLINCCAAGFAKYGSNMEACAPARGYCCSSIRCAWRWTSVTVTSCPETVATVGTVGPPRLCPVKLGTRYQAMEMQMTTRIAPRKYFLNAPDSCRNRIMWLKTPDVNGKRNYKASLNMRGGVCPERPTNGGESNAPPGSPRNLLRGILPSLAPSSCQSYIHCCRVQGIARPCLASRRVRDDRSSV